ncbi:PREDICTED: phosphorylase b kinase gamma catalytic chain, skeletal muscle/heart isoform-like [Acropora digitifera]|uniref:phosphorylase b kinase gamma catalytic chain, skeletal muscle/heart isoform-like n=1 Tax=Acropora digitifera TaxID=70779 RepID=UPI00077A6509|nr:PREDICTED: phosphorylase b kinase gamma catalytic chain, skeletal muscle/heart isoform-like [Acropora digitifera]
MTESDVELESAPFPGGESTGGLSEKYDVKEKLGAGISSVVRRCYHKVTGKPYAVKIIDKLSDAGGVDIEATTREEVLVLLALQGHENIIGLVDVFESDVFFFLVFELAEKGELFDHLTEQVTLSEKKTSYILLNPTELCGTPGYLSPEVLQCSMFPDAPGYGKEVDMWACGVIMYTLLVGCPPFWNRRQVVMLRSIMEARYHFHSPEWDDISVVAKDLVRVSLVLYLVNGRLIHLYNYIKNPCFYMYKHIWTRWEILFVIFPLQGTVIAIIAVLELSKFLKNKMLPVTFETVLREPYGVKPIRKMIDGCAFRIYGHWVKRNKDQNQNRGALFENKPHREKHNVDGHAPRKTGVLDSYNASFRVSSLEQIQYKTVRQKPVYQ